MKNIVTIMFKSKKSFIYFLIFIFISLFYFLASQIPLITEYLHRSPFTVFPLYHTNSDFDFNAYLSVITQSKTGAWLMRDAYTTEKTNPTMFYFFFILVGKMALVFNLAPNIAYHVSRIIGVILYLVSLFSLCRLLLGEKKGFWASILGIIGTVSPIPLYFEPEAYKSYTDWWGNIEAANRLDQMPHYMFSAAFLFIIIQLIFSFFKVKRFWKLILAFVLSLLAGLFFPPMMMPILFCLPSALLFQTIIISFQKKKIVLPKLSIIIGTTVVLAAIAIAFLIMLHENVNGFPWDTWSKWEQGRWRAVTAFDKKLFISFGILPYICLFGIPFIIKSLSLPLYFMTVWAYLPFILLPITNTNLTFISKYRLTSMAPFIPLGILASITAFQVYEKMKMKIMKYSVFLLVILTTVPVTISYLPAMYQYIMANKVATRFYHFYIPVSDWATIEYARNHLPQNSIVLSNRFMGSLLPAYAPVTSFLGHHVHTKNFDWKNYMTERFYSNEMENDEAWKFLKENHIQYVWYGPGETLRSTNLKYPFLEGVVMYKGTILLKVL